MAEVGQRQGQPERGDDDLQEFAAVLLEAGAQGFVTVDDGIDRLFQQGDIERAFESEAHRHVEGSDFRLEQFQIPEDLLGDRGGKCQRLLRAGGRGGGEVGARAGGGVVHRFRVYGGKHRDLPVGSRNFWRRPWPARR